MKTARAAAKQAVALESLAADQAAILARLEAIEAKLDKALAREKPGPKPKEQ